MSQKYFTVLCDVDIVVTTEYLVAAHTAAEAIAVVEKIQPMLDKMLPEQPIDEFLALALPDSAALAIAEYPSGVHKGRPYVAARSNAAAYRKARELTPAAQACVLH